MSFKKLTLALLVTASFGSQAAFTQPNIEISDWKEQGDNLVIYDENTGLSWLSFKATDEMSYDEVAQKLATDFSGWYLPTHTQVEGIMDTMFTSVDHSAWYQTYSSTSDTYLASEYFNDVFGNGTKNKSVAAGMYYHENGNLSATQTYINGHNYAELNGAVNPRFMTNLCSGEAIDHLGSGVDGVWLVSQPGMDYYKTECNGNRTKTLVTPIIGGGSNSEVANVSTGALLSSLLLFPIAAVRRKLK